MSELWKNTVTIGLIVAFTVCIFGMPIHGIAASKRGIDTRRMSVPDYYPQILDGIGQIDRVGEDDIVIGDSLFTLSKHLRCGTLKKSHVKKSSLQEGELVGYVTNDEGEIVSLWILKR